MGTSSMDKKVAVFSLSQGLLITHETSVKLFKQVKQGVYLYLAKIGLIDTPVWRVEDCPDLAEQLDADPSIQFVMMID